MTLFEVKKEVEKSIENWTALMIKNNLQPLLYLENISHNPKDFPIIFERKSFVTAFHKTFEMDYSILSQSIDSIYIQVALKFPMSENLACFMMHLTPQSTNFWTLKLNVVDLHPQPEKIISAPKVVKESKEVSRYNTCRPKAFDWPDMELDNDWEMCNSRDFSMGRDREAGGLSRYFNSLCE